jgi:TatD DNase family protein
MGGRESNFIAIYGCLFLETKGLMDAKKGPCIKNMFIDSHAHLTSPAVLEHLEGMLERAKQQKVEAIVNICTDLLSLQKGLELAERVPWIYNTAATPPHDVAEEGELFFPQVEEAARLNKLVAIGETGLDYYYKHSEKALQRHFLSRYFSLAQRTGLPLIFHCREAFEDLFSLADSEYKGKPAVLHCFTGTLAEARGVLNRGWYLSLSGILTFKKSEGLREVAQYVPLDRLLVETDTPYLAPQSRRGQMNEPSFITETVDRVAALKNLTREQVAEATRSNAHTFFSFSKHPRVV